MNNEELGSVPPQPPHDSTILGAIKRHQFLVMIAGAVVIALALVLVSLSLYVSSGTLQLDLSRPGYDAARKEAYEKNTKVFRGFSSSGPVNQETLDEFDALYTEKTKNISIQAFSGDVLSDKALNLEVSE